MTQSQTAPPGSVSDIQITLAGATGLRTLGVSFAAAKYPKLAAWFAKMQLLPIRKADVERARAYFAKIKSSGLETKPIFWRGDRIEWILARGFHDWFLRKSRKDAFFGWENTMALGIRSTFDSPSARPALLVIALGEAIRWFCQVTGLASGLKVASLVADIVERLPDTALDPAILSEQS